MVHGTSSVGGAGVYEAGDQRNPKASEVPEPNKFEEGKENSHKNLDSKDERSIANKLASSEWKREPEDDAETRMSKQDPTKPAQMHGNEPSKGAKVDAEIAQEEEEELKRLGKK